MTIFRIRNEFQFNLKLVGLMWNMMLFFIQLKLIIGHTEDAPLELLNNVFIVCAEIIGENGKRLEKFSTLAYAGCLPGYTMGFNEHGFVHTINTLYPLENRPGKTRG
jgi:hypothetical protein